MVSYAKNGIFPLGIKCCILAPLTMGCRMLKFQLEDVATG